MATVDPLAAVWAENLVTGTFDDGVADDVGGGLAESVTGPRAAGSDDWDSGSGSGSVSTPTPESSCD